MRNKKIGRREFLSGIALGASTLAALSSFGRYSIRYSNRHLQKQIEILQRDRKAVPSLSGLLDLKGVIHLHTHLSRDSQGSPEEIFRAAGEAGLQFLMTTDHNTRRIFTEGIWGKYDDLLVIRGAELIKGGQALLAINIKEYIDGHRLSIQEAVTEIKAQGGLAFVAHPWLFKSWEVEGIDGMEIYDIADTVYAQAWKAPWLAMDVLTSWKDYPEEVFLTLLSRPDYYLSKWDRLLQKRKLVGIAGNDAHQNVRFLGRQLDPYPLDFKYVQTHLLATALEERPLLEALQAGRSYLSFGLLADATGFQFLAAKTAAGSGRMGGTVGGIIGGIIGMMGEAVPQTPGLTLTVQTPQAGEIRLYRNGEVIDKVASTRLIHPVSQKGIYRVEVSLQIEWDQYPWIISNPIYIV
ncbi:MAG: CehA/McbA family metallohydrolase [Nitrospirae bacterium]|nr:CehA/McbA family metallohydrolase [Candidatus Manganitrophaceae bacterium]